LKESQELAKQTVGIHEKSNYCAIKQ